MCGIVGYIGNNAVDEILLSGLKSLEYRGYDSAGIALNDNQGIDIFRAKGKLQNLSEVINSKHLGNRHISQGIGHIRWATHGEASIENAHPHVSNDGKLVLVHNGIIENYKELKDELIQQGFHFFSQTDTETIVHLVDREYKKTSSLEQAVIRAISMLKGAFALCIMHHDEADKIIAVRKNAPLIIGLGKNENFIASDIPALVGKTQTIIHLEDNELAIVQRDNVIVKNFNGEIKNKHKETICIAQDDISKQGYKHFMIKEINEQPQIVHKMISKYMNFPQRLIEFDKINIEELLENIEKIEIIACGTSLHAAEIAQYMIEDICGISVTVEAASEYIYKKHLTNNKTLSIGISQSGETADTITAIKQAKEKGAKILVLTNRPDSSIVRYANYVLPLNAGIEVSVAATKSYTAQLTILCLLTLGMAEHLKNIDTKKIQQIKQEMLMLPTKMEEIISSCEKIKKCAEKYNNYKNFFYLARGINIATAREGALKLKEISYINANSYAAGELKHGPIALLDNSMPVLAILPNDCKIFEKMLSNCEEAKARHAHLIAMTNAPINKKELFDDIINIPEISEFLSPLLFSIPLQLFAYYIADSLNLDVDQPRNLAKSVTVE